LSKNALERNETLRLAYRHTFGTEYTAEQAVFVDESAFDRRTDMRGRAWALSGKAAIRKGFFIRGKRYVNDSLLKSSIYLYYRYSLLPALSLDGIIYAQIIEGSFSTPSFLEFIQGVLAKMNPFPAKNSVLIMDNARIHHNPIMLEMIQEKYVTIFVSAAEVLSLMKEGADFYFYRRIPRISIQLSLHFRKSKHMSDGMEVSHALITVTKM
jgi:hypothetical protein